MSATKRTSESKRIMRAISTGAAALGLWLSAGSALAANVLQDIRYATAPGGKVDITLQFADSVGEVQAFTTDSPPRIAIDLPGTSNGVSARRIAIGSGATSAVSAAESGGRTRVVVDLFRSAGYTTRSSGNLLVLTVDGGAPVVASADPGKRTANTLNVANIDFRRGDNGAGRVILRFDNEGAATDMRNEGNQVVVDVGNAQIPENLRRRLDVTDFATPVVSLEPRANAGGTRLVINTNGAYESMAYQTGNEYVVEITPKRAAVIAGAGAVGTAAGSERYSGKVVTFNFQDVPVRTVLQLIAEESNLNVVASDTVQGNLTLRLINVPWDQALEIVLRAKGLDKRRDGNVVWIAPQKELADYEQAINAARISLENLSELVTEYIPINYGSAEQIAKLLTESKGSGQSGAAGSGSAPRGFLSPRGSVSFDSRTNTLLVVDVPKTVQEIKQLLAVLDRPVDQVLIEARIVIADETFARELGVRFGVSNPDTNTDSISNISGNIEANSATINSITSTGLANYNAQVAAASSGTPAAVQAATITEGYITNLAAANAAGSIAFSILRNSSLLDLEFSALEAEGRGEIISNPRVITSNQREAIITQGDEIGYVTTQPATAGSVPQATVAFKEALLELKVTPTITQDGRVYLSMNLKKDDVKSFITTATGSVPSLTKRSVSTAVLVDNGNTVVIGGVYEFKSRDDVTKVPWLGDVPFLGRLFKKNGKSNSKAELLIFVTPRVLQIAKR